MSIKSSEGNKKIEITLYTATWCPHSNHYLTSTKGKIFMKQILEARLTKICVFRHFRNADALYMLRKLYEECSDLSTLGVPTVRICFGNEIQILHPGMDHLNIISKWNKNLIQECIETILLDFLCVKELLDIVIDYMIIFFFCS